MFTSAGSLYMNGRCYNITPSSQQFKDESKMLNKYPTQLIIGNIIEIGEGFDRLETLDYDLLQSYHHNLKRIDYEAHFIPYLSNLTCKIVNEDFSVGDKESSLQDVVTSNHTFLLESIENIRFHDAIGYYQSDFVDDICLIVDQMIDYLTDEKFIILLEQIFNFKWPSELSYKRWYVEMLDCNLIGYYLFQHEFPPNYNWYVTTEDYVEMQLPHTYNTDRFTDLARIYKFLAEGSIPLPILQIFGHPIPMYVNFN